MTVVTLDRDVVGAAAGRLPPEDRVDGVRVRRLPGIGGPRWAFTTRPDRVAATLAGHDVVHLHDLRFAVGIALLAAAARDRAVFLHTHGLVFHTDSLARLKAVVLRAYHGPLLRLAGTAIVADSAADRDRLVEVVPALAPRIELIPNAIDLAPSRAVVRDPRPGQLLVFGRVVPSKGLREMVDALGRLRERPWCLDVVGPGEGDEVEVLRARVEAAGLGDRVVFAGAVSDDVLRGHLARADVALFPSRGEGFGLALLEAMAAGVPVLANHIPAHAEVLGPDLEGSLTEFADPERAARAIDDLLADPVRRSRDAELGRVRSEVFGIDRLWGDLRAAYARRGIAG